MSKKLCKGIRKDGSPCQGQGLDQFNGLCIAHGPSPDQAYQWRSEGGKNSATAARLDKRIPERLKCLHDILETGLKQVLDGTLSPARYAAICRGVKLILELYRQADQEMDLIRAEEIQAAAAEFLGQHANLDVLEAADDMAARQDKHRREALVDQDYAEVKEPLKPGQPSEIFLNDRGRRRFGYRNLKMNQQFLNEIDDELTEYDPRQSDLSEITELLEVLQEKVEDSLSTLARDDVAPFDPLTGQSITELPAGVQTRSRLHRLIHDEVKPRERLEEQLSMIKHLMRKAEELAQDEDDKQELEVSETYGQEPEVAATYGQELELAATYGREPEEAPTYGQELQLAPTCSQEPEEVATCGEELKVAATCGEELKVAATCGQEPEMAATDGQEPEEAATNGQEPEEAATNGQKPEAAQQGSKKLQYIKEALKASGVPIESVPANYRWE